MLNVSPKYGCLSMFPYLAISCVSVLPSILSAWNAVNAQLSDDKSDNFLELINSRNTCNKLTKSSKLIK